MEIFLGLVVSALLTVGLTVLDQTLFGIDWAWWIWLIISLVVVFGGFFIYVETTD